MGSGITRRDAVKRMALAATALQGAASAEEARSSRPNIIFILADDLGYGDLGCYGQERILTPNIDRLAAEGMRFTDAYAGSTVCAPSRCVLMTGLHTGHCTVRGNSGVRDGKRDRIPLREGDVTVAAVLKGAGYATGMVGKWGLGEPGTTGLPNHQGFDEWFGYLNQGHAHNYYPEYLWRNERKVELPGNLNGERQQYSHDLFTREALEFIRRHADERFFLYLPYTIPHANNELGRETGDGMEVPDYGPYTDEDWPAPQKGHAAMITRMDGDVGRIMRLLRDLGIDEDTLVCFTSDNGPHKEGGADAEFFDSNGPLRGIKRALYEGGVRVPMIARWPVRIAAGSETDHITGFWDFLPTAAELGGADCPGGVDGHSIAPTLLGETQPQPECVYWEFHEGGFGQAVRMGNWKAVRSKTRGNPIELYDLSEDLGEQHDLEGAHPDIVAKARRLFESARRDSETFPIRESR